MFLPLLEIARFSHFSYFSWHYLAEALSILASDIASREREGVSKYVQGYCLQKYVWRIFLFNNFNIDAVSVSQLLCNIVLHQCHNCLTLSGVTVWQIFKGSISCSTAAVKLMQISGLHECELFVETVCILFAGCEPNDWHLWRYFNPDAYEWFNGKT